MIRESQTAESLMRRPEVTIESLVGCFPESEQPSLSERTAQQVNNQARYAGYLDRQQTAVDKQREQQSVELPESLDYHAIRGLSNEMIEKLSTIRPHTLGQAARIPGVTPAAIQLLMVHLR